MLKQEAQPLMDTPHTVSTLQIQDVLSNHRTNRVLHQNNKLLPIIHESEEAQWQQVCVLCLCWAAYSTLWSSVSEING